MNKYKLSVIIPVYNTEKYLSRAIDSVLRSSMKDAIEIIVVDDASKGSCKEIVEKYLNVRYIKHEINQGLFHARYTGIMHATGEFIAHLDPDDWVENDVYTKTYESAILNSSDVVLFNVVQCDESGKEWFEDFNMLPEFQNKSGKDILNHIYFFGSRHWIWHVCWNKLIKREIAQNMLLTIDNLKHLIMYEDLLWSTLLFMYLKQSYSISSIQTIGLKYFRHSDAITSKSDIKSFIKKIEDIQFVLKNIDQLFKSNNLHKEYSLLFLETKYYIYSIYFQSELKHFEKTLPQFGEIYTFLNTYNSKATNTLLLEQSAKEIIQKVVQKKIKEVTIFGLGDFAIMMLKKLKDNNIDVTSFTVTKPIEQSFMSLPIYSIEDSLKCNNTNFIISSLGSFYTIKESILQKSKNAQLLNVIGKFD